MNDGAAPAGPTPPAGGFRLDDYDAIMDAYDNAPPPQEPAPPQPAKQGRLADLQPEAEAEADPQAEAEPADDEAIEAEPVESDAFELAQKAREWSEQPDLPEEFMSKTGVAKVDGEEHVITVKEAFEGYQRRAITTQKQQEAAAVKNHYTQLLHGVRQQYDRWAKDTAAMRLELRDMGFDTIALAKLELQEYAEDQRYLDAITDPQLRQSAARRLQQGRENEALARRHARELEAARANQQQNQGAQQHAAIQQRVNNQLAQLAPRAFREVGMKVSPFTKRLLGEELSAIHEWGKDLTYDVVLEALKNAKDRHDMDQERALATRAAGLPPRSRALPPRRASANPPAGAAKPANGKKPWRLDDYEDVMREYDQGR